MNEANVGSPTIGTPAVVKQEPDKVKRTRRRAHTKTSRACNHCHKAHMTCDDSRPCKRCVQRGFGDTCVDAPRKKKKYLMGIGLDQPNNENVLGSDVSAVGTPKESPFLPLTSNSNTGYPSPLNQFQYTNGIPKDANFPMGNPNFRKTPFLSNAANLEYSILGNIVNDPYSPSMSPNAHASLSDDSRRHSGQIVSYPELPNSDNNGGHPPLQHLPSYSIPTLPPQPKPQYEQRKSQQNSVSSDVTTLYLDTPQYDSAINQYYIGPVHGVNEETSKSINFPDIINVIKENEKNNPKSFFNHKGASISFSVGLTSEDEYNRKVVDQENISSKHGGLRYKEPSEIYSKTLKPFSYYPGYHQLLNYLTSRFNKTQLVSMAKTMAEYRPSFIAATCNLKEDDLIFMEQCFQRTLLEYDNYISISGTPTMVWRRTGQIAYVGNEFCILTGWTKSALMDRVSFLVELLDDESCLEYFKVFNKILFGDFRGASMSECTLLSPNSQKIRCRCVMTLKRDVFGIPMMIIGNFLPILSDYGELEE